MATEVRCALALNGGVSLAIWIGGLIDELLQLVNAGAGEDEARPEYKALCQELDVIPKIDVIAGTSAGGLNGAFLATGLVNGCRDLSPLRQLWIEQGSFSELLRGPRDPDLPSLLRGEWFLDRIEDALKEVAAQGSGTRSVDPPLDVRLTATSLDGMLITIPDGPASLHTTDHRVEFRFLNDDFDFGAPNASARVARACRSTASFPGAFEPSPVATGLYDERHAPALVPWLSDKPSYLVDGGVLANLPALNAVDAIISQPSRERVERVLGLVVPDPGAQPAGIDDSVPFAAAVSRSAVGIPRNQSLADFVGEVNDHNLEVRGRRAARAALLEQFASMAPPDAWKTFLTVSEALFPSYRAARHRTSIDRMAQRLSSRLSAGTSAALERDAGDVELLPLLPWVPRRFDGEADDWAWGGSPIRRLSALLVTWINAAAAAASAVGNEGVERSLLAHKRAVTEIRVVADELSPRGVLDELFLQELSEPEATTDALRAASSRWAGADGSGGRPLHDLLNQLAIQLTDVLDLVRPIAAAVTDQTSSSTLRGLLNLVDGAGSNEVRRLLLGIEVIEVAFSGTEPRPDQLLRLAQFSSTRPVTIDPLGRDTAAEKLAGVQLGHFAAFLKRSWRANDWMWGRLDASERAVRLLSEVSPTPLSGERLTYHLRAVQASILREMLPVVAVQVEADGLAGGRVSPEARVFVDAVTTAGTARPDGPVSLASVSEDDLAQLLARDQVGVEQIGDEAGSKLVSSVALTALATSTALLRRQGPRGVRGPVALMATGSMMAWRWKRRSRTTQRLIILALIAVIGAAAVAVVVDITRTDLGWWVLPAWLILILGALWGAIQAVPVQRIIQRRAASQAGQAIEAVVPTAGGGSS